MLILGRRQGQKIVIAESITITILEVRENGHVQVGIDAPREIEVRRNELPPRENCSANNIDSGILRDELIAAACHLVSVEKNGLSIYIRENGRHGLTSAWAEFIEAVRGVKQ